MTTVSSLVRFVPSLCTCFHCCIGFHAFYKYWGICCHPNCSSKKYKNLRWKFCPNSVHLRSTRPRLHPSWNTITALDSWKLVTFCGKQRNWRTRHLNWRSISGRDMKARPEVHHIEHIFTLISLYQADKHLCMKICTATRFQQTYNKNTKLCEITFFIPTMTGMADSSVLFTANVLDVKARDFLCECSLFYAIIKSGEYN